MALRIITGRANAGKSGLLYAEIRAHVATGNRPVLLLPTEPDVRRARSEFATTGVGGLRIAALDGWAAEFWALYGDGRTFVGAAHRELLLAQIIERRDGGHRERALRSGLTRTLALLAQRIHDPKAITARSHTDASICDLLIDYCGELEARGLVEFAGAVELLGSRLPSRLPPVFINRFTDLSEAQERFVVALSRRTNVWIALPWEEGHPATEVLGPLVERLRPFGECENIETETPNDELALLESRLYRPAGDVRPTGMVSMVEAPDASGEITLAVDIIRDLVGSGIAPSRIVFTCRRAEQRVAAVIAAAGEAGVPLFADVRIPLAGTPFGTALLALLDVVAFRGPTRERFWSFVRSAYSGASTAMALDLDREWRQRRSGAREITQSLYGRCREARRAIRAAERVRAHAAQPCDWKELADALIANSRMADFRAATVSRDASAHRAVIETVNSAMLATGEALNETEMRILLGNTRVAEVWGSESEGVHFTEAHRVRSMRYDAMILCGLNADEFAPEKAVGWETAFLERVGLDTEEASRLRERLLFYALVTRPRVRLALIRAQTDSAGRPARPSSLWEEVADVYRTPEEASRGAIPDRLAASLPSSGGSAFRALAYSPGRRSERMSGEAPWRPERARPLGRAALDGLRAIEEFSVTEIEMYLRCPYLWFLERALRPRDIDSALGAREEGSAAHEVLSRFYRQWKDVYGTGRVCCGSVSVAHDMLDRICDEVLAGYGEPQTLEEEYGLARVRTWVAGVVEDDVTILPGFEVHVSELRFGEAAGRPFEFGGVRLKGGIDRVDTGDGGVVVTDYKAAATVKGHGSFFGAGLIQLPAYVAAAAEMLDLRPAGGIYRSLKSRKARGFWLDGVVDLGAAGSRSDRLSETRISEVIGSAEERVASAVEGIRAGIIEPKPGSGACAFCPAANACPAGEKK